MEQHIFGVRNKIHIINLEHTVEMIKPALSSLKVLQLRIIKFSSLALKELQQILLKMKRLDAHAICQ